MAKSKSDERGTWAGASKAKQRNADRARSKAARFMDGDYRHAFYMAQAVVEQTEANEFAARAKASEAKS